MNILFTCAGRRVALLEAFRDAMRRLDVAGELLATGATLATPALHKADHGLIVPMVDENDYIPSLLEIVRRHRIGLLVPLTDLDLLILAARQGEFAEAGCTVMIGSEPAVALCRDKARVGEVFKRAGLVSVETFTLEDFLARPFYPCFVKPVGGSAGVGAAVMHDQRELASHAATYGRELIVQEFVPGQEFTIDVYRSRDGQVRCVVPRQRLAVRSGEVEQGITVKDQALMQAATHLAETLDGLWGAFCCQCLRDRDGVLHFFEINPRFGGGAPLAIAAGADLPLYLLQDVLGLPITASLGQITDRLLMMRYDQAVFIRADDPHALPGYDQPSFR